ncbi:MAG TPA: GNAT family N-acetyltransferase [Ktedonobacteraceae bacterium]|nr:GNAT family N-acetyltransferase [Ktedonobacteraceae bacterium]
MDEILRKLSTPAIIAAIEANLAEEMAAFGRYFPGAELHEDEEVRWFSTGLSTSFNGVLRTHITSDDIDARIDEVVGYFKTRHLPLTWSVGPTALPTNLATYLKAHGFTRSHDGTGMAADLQALHEENVTPDNFRVEVVSDEALLETYTVTSMRGFGNTEEEIRVYHETYKNIGFGKHLPWQHFIGWLADEPVAVSSLLLHAGVAGIFGVATIPEARRQGIGAAMTLAPLREARQRGYRVGVLSPSEMGSGVYKRLGFRTYCTLSFYRLAQP